MAGSTINYSNICSLAGGSWTSSVSLSGTNSTVTYYIAAPAWYFSFTIQGSELWGYQEGSVSVEYWNGSSWVHVYGSSEDVRGSSNSYTWSWQHCYSGGGVGDERGKHFWRLIKYAGDNDGSASGTLYVGPLSLVPENHYNTYFKNRLIKSIAVVITTSDFSNGSSFDSTYGSGYLRGNTITDSRAKYLCAYV